MTSEYEADLLVVYNYLPTDQDKYAAFWLQTTDGLTRFNIRRLCEDALYIDNWGIVNKFSIHWHPFLKHIKRIIIQMQPMVGIFKQITRRFKK